MVVESREKSVIIKYIVASRRSGKWFEHEVIVPESDIKDAMGEILTRTSKRHKFIQAVTNQVDCGEIK